MLELPWSKINCDTNYGSGGLYFYQEYFEWRHRSAAYQHVSFKVRYDEIADIKMIPTHKKQVEVTTKDGKKYTLLMYNIEYFTSVVNQKIEEGKGEKKKPAPKQIEKVEEPKDEDDLAKLERLSKLHESGSLTDEEFKAAKAKILGL